MPTLTLRDIASSIDGEAKGNVDFTISHLSEAQRCTNNQICFIKDESFISKLSEDAGAVIPVSYTHLTLPTTVDV